MPNFYIVLNPYREIERLTKIIEEQAKVIDELKARLDRFENPKNSRNSSIPPSHDLTRPKRTKSLRERSNKKPGGQPGHEGKTLEMVEKPDEIVEYSPEYCTCCGRDISQITPELVERRQEVVLPVIQTKIVEHQIFQRICTCGQSIVAEFPFGITSGISYGKNVETLAAYMSVRQFVPFHRLSEMFRYVFNIPISAGALVNAVKRVAEKSIPDYELIRKQAETSKVSGGDETGAKINGKKGWFWTIQGKLFTFIMASYNRGAQTLNQHFPNGFVFSVLVHDCWKCYFKIASVTHQICLAHILRELNHINECYEIQWAIDFKQLLTEAIAFKKTFLPKDYDQPKIQISEFEDRLTTLLQETIKKEHPIAVSLQNRLVKYRQYIFTFLYYIEVPPDNNGSERAIRNIKVKQKISGQFKSIAGAESFAILRSIIDTAIKNSLNPLDTLTKINVM